MEDVEKAAKNYVEARWWKLIYGWLLRLEDAFKKGAAWQKSRNDWHDLEANPNDLPKHREIVAVKIKFDIYHFAIAAYNEIKSEWYIREDDEFYLTEKPIIKWRYLE